MKPVIYFVHYSTSPGGIEVLLPLIISELKEQEIRIFVIRPTRADKLSVYSGMAVDITYGSDSTIIALWKFFRFCLKNNFGIYHLFNTGPFFLLALRLAGVKKVIYSIHGTNYWTTYIQKKIRKLFWYLGNTSSTIYISNSDYSAKVFNEKVLKQPGIRKIYNPIDSSRFNSHSLGKTSGSELEIIYAGRLADGKNLFLWIDTAESLIEKGINASFSIYGTGELYNELAKRLQVSKHKERIKLRGHVSRIEEIYKSADLLMFLSEYESFGNVVVESVLCGVPVIALDIPAMKEIFQDFPNFLIDKSRDIPNQVFNRLQRIELLRSDAQKASQNFSIRFGIQQHIDQLSAVYKSLKR